MFQFSAKWYSQIRMYVAFAVLYMYTYIYNTDPWEITFRVYMYHVKDKNIYKFIFIKGSRTFKTIIPLFKKTCIILSILQKIIFLFCGFILFLFSEKFLCSKKYLWKYQISTLNFMQKLEVVTLVPGFCQETVILFDS